MSVVRRAVCFAAERMFGRSDVFHYEFKIMSFGILHKMFLVVILREDRWQGGGAGVFVNIVYEADKGGVRSLSPVFDDTALCGSLY